MIIHTIIFTVSVIVIGTIPKQEARLAAIILSGGRSLTVIFSMVDTIYKVLNIFYWYGAFVYLWIAAIWFLSLYPDAFFNYDRNSRIVRERVDKDEKNT